MKKAIVLALALGAGAAFAEFKAGFARVEATPPLGIPLVGYFSHRVADGVLDPLYIDCVAVSDGTNNALIYCVDDLHLTNPFMAKAFPAITQATGVPRDRIYVHATHIHTDLRARDAHSHRPRRLEERRLLRGGEPARDVLC